MSEWVGWVTGTRGGRRDRDPWSKECPLEQGMHKLWVEGETLPPSVRQRKMKSRGWSIYMPSHVSAQSHTCTTAYTYVHLPHTYI